MTSQLTRRRLLAGAAAALFAAGCAPSTVPPLGRRARRIGMFSSGAAPSAEGLAAFREGMKDEGFAEGGDYVLEFRSAEGVTERLVPLAQELIAIDVDLILATSTGPTQAARAITGSVPIVMLASHDPVEARVVANLAQPGGNVTGQSLMGGDLMPKQLEILRELATVRRLAYLTPDVPSPAPGYPSVTDVFTRSMREHGTAAGIDVQVFTTRGSADFDAMLEALTRKEVDAIYLIASPAWAPALVKRIVDHSIRRRLPSISDQSVFAQQGLLMSYGASGTNVERMRSVTRFVAKILRGAKPGDLPVERPTNFELILNAKTAAALGVTFPKPLLDRADVVIR